jgi:signal recognition particle GTPase
MSKMSELVLDIEYLMNKGLSFVEIARELEIPVHFVVEAAGSQDLEEFSPHVTVNS